MRRESDPTVALGLCMLAIVLYAVLIGAVIVLA